MYVQQHKMGMPIKVRLAPERLARIASFRLFFPFL